MSTARVDDIEALKRFRGTLFKFSEAANIALSDAESDIRRTINWLENEQTQKWTSEHRKRLGLLQQAKEKLRMKKIFTGPAGSKQSTVDEEKIVKICTAKVEEADRKMVAIKKWGRQLQRDLLVYKGQTQRFSTSTTVDIPVAAAVLQNMIVRLEAYASIAPMNAASAVGAESTAGMTKSPAEGGASLAELLQKLRDGTPGLKDRANAAPEPIDLSAGAAERISDEDRAALKTLAPVDAEPIADGATLVVSNAVVGKTRLYLQRLAPVNERDCGWFLGPAQIGANPFNLAMTVAELLKVRPDWQEILSFPAGTLVVVDGGVVVAVISEQGVDRWGELNQAKLEQALEAGSEKNADATAPSVGHPANDPAVPLAEVSGAESTAEAGISAGAGTSKGDSHGRS